MESIVTSIEIDLYSPATYIVVKAQQHDNNTRIIKITLKYNGKEYVIPDNVIIQFEGHRGNNTSFIKKCTLEGNVIVVTLDNDILNFSGQAEAKVVMYDSNKNEILSTPTIRIPVAKDPCDKNNIVSEYKSVIDEIIMDINNIENTIKEHTSDTDIHITKEEHERYNELVNEVISTTEPVNQKSGDFWLKIIS